MRFKYTKYTFMLSTHGFCDCFDIINPQKIKTQICYLFWAIFLVGGKLPIVGTPGVRNQKMVNYILGQVGILVAPNKVDHLIFDEILMMRM